MKPEVPADASVMASLGSESESGTAPAVRATLEPSTERDSPSLVSTEQREEQESDRNTRGSGWKTVRVLIRTSIGLGLIAFLASRTDLDSVLSAFGDANLAVAALAYLLVFVALVVGGARWHAYLHRLSLEVPLRRAVLLSIVGAFFNAFLPTGIGGDAYRAVKVRHGSGTTTWSFASVILDRAAGVVGMAVLALIGTTFLIARGQRAPDIVVGALCAAATLAIYVATMVLGRRSEGSAPPSGQAGVLSQMALLLRAVAYGAADLRTSARALTLGVVTGGLLLTANVLLAIAVDVSIPAGGMAALLLLASLAAVIPLSINGIGFREAVYVWGFSVYGAGQDSAFAFAILVLGASLIASAVGGIVFATTGDPSG